MSINNRLNRRRFLQLSGAGSLSALGVGKLWGTALAAPSAGFAPDVELELVAARTKENILPGRSTPVFSYHGKVLKGDKQVLQNIPGSYLGPIIRVNQGQKVRVIFNNQLGEQSIIHWHGLHVPEAADGHPRYAVSDNHRYVYEFEVKNRAGSYWYHPHPHSMTGRQVYGGLAGLFIVSDDEEQKLALPAGEYDLPLVIQDRSFGDDNRLRYIRSPMQRMTGFFGDKILVNGMLNYIQPVTTRPYRVRLYNGSNSRIYKLAWSNGDSLTVIGTDGGLLEQPVTRPYVTLAPAERIELWVDFSKDKVGTTRMLHSLKFSAGSTGMMGMMMGGAGQSQDEFHMMSFSVQKKVSHNVELPNQLQPMHRFNIKNAVNLADPRQFQFTMAHMSWGINGRTFSMNDVATDEIVKLNSTEVWEISNDAGGMGMGMMRRMGGMPHPLHIHGRQFLVIDRSVASDSKGDWLTVNKGFVDEGWKDTVLVMPGERVKLLMRFTDFTGTYLYHCHNLEHEDLGMMRNYKIVV